jgi:transcriptional regulator with PAS, ATPase and Fis domain
VVEEVIERVRRISERREILRELKELRRELREEKGGIPGLVGESPVMKNLMELIHKVAPTASPVLLQGETGVGKELVARTIHELSERKGSFVAINCAGFPETLLESELFGYNRGAFTGANTDKPGFFEIASEGTLFLDEISEIPLHLQAKLLRVLEAREFFRLGSTRPQRFTGRIIASTNRDLRSLIQEGRFRDDLYYRISTFLITIPPLRERVEDILPLAEGFAKKFSRELKKPWLGFSPGAVRILKGYSWGGNARELRNAIERALILSDSGKIEEKELSYLLGASVQDGSSSLPLEEENKIIPLDDKMRELEKRYLLKVLDALGGDKRRAAELLKINLATLYRKLHEHGLFQTHPPKERSEERSK